MKKIIHAIILVFYFFAIPSVFAETIKLISGRVIEGEIVEKDDKLIKIKTEEKIITIPTKMIDDGANKRKSLFDRFRRKNKKSSQLSVREQLRKIREEEYLKAQKLKEELKVVSDDGVIKEDKEGVPEVTVDNSEVKKAELDEYDYTQDACPDFPSYIIQCAYITCLQKHPQKRFIVEHSFKGLYSPDGAKNKCNYHQTIPGESGDTIDCYLDPNDRKQFLRSVANNQSPVFSENQFLQESLEKGRCVKVNFSSIRDK